MYRRCLHCATDLGRNEAIEHFPVGRRLAFDSAKGRLWVVCRACERWNLTPLEERWEAVEECERAFQQTRLRMSTENVGLARLSEGLDLVRIGVPRRPEFASWRYGDQFGRRRTKFLVTSALVVGAVGGIWIGSAGILGVATVGMLPIHLGQLAHRLWTIGQAPVRVVSNTGQLLEIKPTQVSGSKLRPAGTGSECGWQLQVPHRKGTAVLTGGEAVHALGLLLPKINKAGGSQAEIRAAVRELEEEGDPHHYFASAESRARKLGHGYQSLGFLPRGIRLALEMAANEEAERRALEGELALLERAWKEAEEIAAIADDLLVSEKVQTALRHLKQGF